MKFTHVGETLNGKVRELLQKRFHCKNLKISLKIHYFKKIKKNFHNNLMENTNQDVRLMSNKHEHHISSLFLKKKKEYSYRLIGLWSKTFDVGTE